MRIQLPINAPEIVPIEEIGRAKICITLIQYLPFRRCEKILFVQSWTQVGSEAPHKLRRRSSPVRRTCSRQTGYVRKRSSTGRLDTTTTRSCLPADDLPRIMQRHPYDPTVIVTTVAKMTAERYVEDVIKYSQGRALILIT